MIVLDTHAWLWWMVAPKKLSSRARAAIEDSEAIGVSTMSCWEVAMLAERGRIELESDVVTWIGRALATERVEAIELTPPIAVSAALLERRGFHRDPADRIIYASARERRAKLVTKDSRLHKLDRANTVW